MTVCVCDRVCVLVRPLTMTIILYSPQAMEINPIRSTCGFASLVCAILMLHCHSCYALEAFAAHGVVASGLSGTALEVLQHLKARQSNDSEVWRETWCPDNTGGCSSDTETRYSWNLRTGHLQLKVRKVCRSAVMSTCVYVDAGRAPIYCVQVYLNLRA